LSSIAPFRIMAAFAHAATPDEAARTLVCGHEHAVAALLAARRYVPLLAGRIEDTVRVAVCNASRDMRQLLALAPLRALQEASVPASCAFSHAATTVLALHLQRPPSRPNVQELLDASPVFFRVLITAAEAASVIRGACSRAAAPAQLAMPFIASLLMLRFNPSGFSLAMARNTSGAVMQTAAGFAARAFETEVLRAVRFSLGVVGGLRDAVGPLLSLVVRECSVLLSLGPSPTAVSCSLTGTQASDGAASQSAVGGSQLFRFEFPSQPESMRSTQSQSFSQALPHAATQPMANSAAAAFDVFSSFAVRPAAG
jgi:hypothetical protein